MQTLDRDQLTYEYITEVIIFATAGQKILEAVGNVVIEKDVSFHIL